MAEGGFDGDIPGRGTTVEVVGKQELYALAMDPMPESPLVYLQQAETPRDPLFKKMDTTFTFEPDDVGYALFSRLYFNDEKIEKDGGYYPKNKREEIQQLLRKAGIKRTFIDAHGLEYYKMYVNQGDIYLRFGSPTREKHEASLEEAFTDRFGPEEAQREVESFETDPVTNPYIQIQYQFRPGGNQDDFIGQYEDYGDIYREVLKALYQVEGMQPPDNHIILAPPSAPHETAE